MRNLLNSSGAGSPLYDTILKGDGVLYDISWQKNEVDLSKVELPSRDLAEYFANTVSIHFGSLYHLYNKDVFLQKLQEFYSERENGVQKPTVLWHIQMLLIFACGKSIIAREAFQSGPTGMSFFLPAIEGLPDIRTLQQEPVLSIEILCLLALFLEAADIRSGAYGYVCRSS
jgi:proline utilization trans-activator